MTAIPDHYAALGIDPTADQEVIAAAYRALAKKYHPDTGATTGTANADRFAEIQQAYEVLGSPEGRSRYDAELLEATQKELDEHLARKQRKIAGSTGEAPLPPPDLGDIRPMRQAGRPAKWNVRGGLKDMGPFLVVSVLLMAVAGGIAALFLRQAPLHVAEQAAPPRPPQSIEAPGDPASAPAPAPKPAPAVTPVPEPPPPPPQQQAATPAQTPLFGTSMLDSPAATPQSDSAGAAQDLPAAPETSEAPAAVPVPKAKPQIAEAQEPAVAQSRSRRFTVVIYEKYPSGDVVQDQARVVFASEDRCAAFGERTVLRRLAPYEGQRRRPRIWYECSETP